MSTMNLVTNMTMEPYMDAQAAYAQPLSMDMLDDLSWPCQFMVSFSALLLKVAVIDI